jgi:hypothetical protein
VNKRRLKKAMLKAIHTLLVTPGEKRAIMRQPRRAAALVCPDYPANAGLLILLRKYVVDAPVGVDCRRWHPAAPAPEAEER